MIVAQVAGVRVLKAGQLWKPGVEGKKELGENVSPSQDIA
jgi:hypothetical protein